MPRSDRNKVRREVLAAANDLDRAMEKLARIDVIADGRSNKIDETLPLLVTMLEGCKDVLVKFRSEI